MRTAGDSVSTTTAARSRPPGPGPSTRRHGRGGVPRRGARSRSPPRLYAQPSGPARSVALRPRAAPHPRPASGTNTRSSMAKSGAAVRNSPETRHSCAIAQPSVPSAPPRAFPPSGILLRRESVNSRCNSRRGLSNAYPATPPTLNAAYEDRDENGDLIQVSVSADAQLEWDQYVAGDWTPWALKAAVARQVWPVYQKLFSIYQQMAAAADTFDLFVGVGLFHSKTNPEQVFRRHLLAFPAELSLDDRSGTLSLGPSSDFISARFETDFVPTTERVRLQPQIDSLQRELADVGGGLADRTTLGDLLTRLITPVTAVTRYVPSLAAVDATGRNAVVSFGAALILRARSTRSLEALLERIEKDASGVAPRFSLNELPVPWRKMVEDDSTWDATSEERAARSRVTSSGRVYFPLASNEEQSRIVQKAEGTPGVVVQGPPGTGQHHKIDI